MPSCIVLAHGNIGHRCIKVLTEYNLDIKLIVTHNEASQGRNAHSINNEETHTNEKPVFVYTPDGLEEFSKKTEIISPDYLFSINFTEALPEQIVHHTKIASYLLHTSLLPHYRGHSSLEWSLINGEKKTGLTLCLVENNTQDLYVACQKTVPILSEDHYQDVEKKLTVSGEIMLFEMLPRILNQTVYAQPLSTRSGSYFRRLEKSDGYFSWKWQAERIHNLIRAFSPPQEGAFFDRGKNRFWIYKSRLTSLSGTPGHFQYQNERLFIFAGNGQAIEVLSIASEEGILSLAQWVHQQKMVPAFEV